MLCQALLLTADPNGDTAAVRLSGASCQ